MAARAKGWGGENLNSDRPMRGGRQGLQWQVPVRETESKRDKQAARQAQCSSAVQAPAAGGGCCRTDRPPVRDRTQTAPLGAQSSQTAPGSSLERKPGPVGGPGGKFTAPNGSAAAADRLGAEALRGTMTRVSGDAAAIKSWPCPRTSCCRIHPARRKVDARPSQGEHLCPEPIPNTGIGESLPFPPAHESQHSSTPWVLLKTMPTQPPFAGLI